MPRVSAAAPPERPELRVDAPVKIRDDAEAAYPRPQNETSPQTDPDARS